MHLVYLYTRMTWTTDGGRWRLCRRSHVFLSLENHQGIKVKCRLCHKKTLIIIECDEVSTRTPSHSRKIRFCFLLFLSSNNQSTQPTIMFGLITTFKLCGTIVCTQLVIKWLHRFPVSPSRSNPPTGQRPSARFYNRLLMIMDLKFDLAWTSQSQRSSTGEWPGAIQSFVEISFENFRSFLKQTNLSRHRYITLMDNVS